MAAQAVAGGRPLEWFEQVYAAAGSGGTPVPWADQVVNPHLASWARLDPAVMRRVLVVGCGFGDDAQWLAARVAVTAFDISPTAVAAARAAPGQLGRLPGR